MFTKSTLVFEPAVTTTIPQGDGYYVYSAMLNEIQQHDPSLSRLMHDADTGVNISMLNGRFERVSKSEKRVFANERYTVETCLAGQQYDHESFRDIIRNDVEHICINEADFTVVERSLEVDTTASLASNIPDGDYIHFDFYDPTVISYHDQLELLPQRGVVFTSIQSKWNKVAPETCQIELDEETIRRCCHLNGGDFEIDMYSICVSANEDHFTPAYIAQTTYERATDDDGVWQQLLLLAQAAEYLGVGSHIARGLGTVNIHIDE